MYNRHRNYCAVCKQKRTEGGISSPYRTFICIDCADMILDVWGRFHEEHLDQCDEYLTHIRNRCLEEKEI